MSAISSNANNFEEERAFGRGITISAGGMLLDFFGRVSIAGKGSFDIVTTADHAIERYLVAQIAQRFPAHQVLAEEGTGHETVLSNEFCWVIDPLDGTVNFASGIPFYCVSVALLHEGTPLLAWVFDPVRDELFFAERGRGSFLNQQRLHMAFDPMLPFPIGASTGTILGSDAASSRVMCLLAVRFGRIRILGSQALQLCYVGAGRLQAALSSEAKLWDDAAGSLIAQEAGATYTDFHGRPVFPLPEGSTDLTTKVMRSIAASPSILHDVLAIIARESSGPRFPCDRGG